MNRVSKRVFDLLSSKTRHNPCSQIAIRKSKIKNAFTLIELLVVIAIIGILAALLFSALSTAKERAIRAKCLSNVRQITIASLNYAIDNRDRLPDMTTPLTGHLLVPGLLGGPAVTEFVTRYCSTRAVFIDPGYPELAQLPLDFTSDLAYKRIGYAVTFPGSGVTQTNINTFSVPQPIVSGNVVLPAPVSSDRVLVAGIVATRTGQTNFNPVLRTNYNYMDVPFMDFDLDSTPAQLRTSHLKNKTAIGDNLGMLDGSARWRKFRDMQPRTLPTQATLWW